jgi:hypothetical protein
MLTATLYRTYHPNFTAGVIASENQLIYTVERPWVQDDAGQHRAGTPFESCVPEGLYDLYRFKRKSGDLVWSIGNPDLGVFLTRSGRLYDTDRYACLIHTANHAHEVVGCIGPGLGALHRSGGYKVTHSREAMAALEFLLSDITHLEITSYDTIAKKTTF